MEADELMLRRRIMQGEGQHLDFKHSITDSRKIARSMSAFANAGGGSLLIGVRDSGSIAGIKSEEEFYMVELAAEKHCRPSMLFKPLLWKLDNKDILEVVIDSRPDQLNEAHADDDNWQVWVREKDENHLANNVWIDVWHRSRLNYNFTVDFDNKYKKALRLFETNDSLESLELMIHLRLPLQETEKLIADLILLKYVSICYTAEGIVYRYNKSQIG